jgi:hypothetical protein
MPLDPRLDLLIDLLTDLLPDMLPDPPVNLLAIHSVSFLAWSSTCSQTCRPT